VNGPDSIPIEHGEPVEYPSDVIGNALASGTLHDAVAVPESAWPVPRTPVPFVLPLTEHEVAVISNPHRLPGDAAPAESIEKSILAFVDKANAHTFATPDGPVAPPAPAVGMKLDAGKLPLELLPTDALEEVAKVLQFGARKYARRNWEKGISFSRVAGAVLRHTFAWLRGEDNDAETGLSHMAHAACECLFLVAFVCRGRKDLDDRNA
jgi:hypothetical protein